PIANRGPQKSTGGGRKSGQLFSVEHEGGRGGYRCLLHPCELARGGRTGWRLAPPIKKGGLGPPLCRLESCPVHRRRIARMPSSSSDNSCARRYPWRPPVEQPFQ